MSPRVMDVFMFLWNTYGETLLPNVMILGGGAMGVNKH